MKMLKMLYYIVYEFLIGVSVMDVFAGLLQIEGLLLWVDRTNAKQKRGAGQTSCMPSGPGKPQPIFYWSRTQPHQSQSSSKILQSSQQTTYIWYNHADRISRRQRLLGKMVERMCSVQNKQLLVCHGRKYVWSITRFELLYVWSMPDSMM